MPKSVVVLTLSVFFVASVFFTSCKDDNSYLSYNAGLNASNDYVIGQQMMALILNTYFKSISDSLLLVTGHSNIDGASVYFGGGETDTLFIRYPDWGASDGYGHWRAGDINVSTNNGFFDPSTEVQFYFVDFSFDKDTLRVDNFQVQYMGKADGQNDLFSVFSDTVHQTFSDTSGVNKFWMQQSFLWIKDASSIYHTPQDKFEISGWLNGKSREGVYYFTEISEEQPLLNQFNCSFLKQEPVAINFSNLTYDGNIYFSDPDSCVNQYVVVIEESPFPHPIYNRNW